MSKSHLGFLDHRGIRFIVPAPQFTFQQQKQPEFTWCEVQAVWWILFHFSVVALKPLLHKSSMRPSIVLMKNPRSKKFWSFLPVMIEESFQYHLVIPLLSTLNFIRIKCWLHFRIFGHIAFWNKTTQIQHLASTQNSTLRSMLSLCLKDKIKKETCRNKRNQKCGL